ncbi:MAG: DUF393 domain-containing protein [Sediminibacterium sp.]|nr:DUF393 domain-containing protein [Sediminibacterium sp.]
MEKMVLLFDSGCKLCNSSIKFVTKGDKKQQIKQIPLSSIEGAAIVAKYPSLQNINSIIFIANNKLFIESRDNIYRWIAKNRYQWFGRI